MGRAFRQQFPARFRIKLKSEDQGLAPYLLDAGLQRQELPVFRRAPEAAPGLHDGQPEAFLDVLEGLFGRQIASPQVLFDGPVAVAEIADEVDDAVGVRIPEAHPHLDAVHAEGQDVAYLLAEVRQAFSGVQMDDIFYTTAGLRSLVVSRGRKASDVSRAHKLIDHERRDGVLGFISVAGGKLTGYRAIAQEAVDLVCHKLGIKTPCTTAELPLPGASPVSAQEVEKAAQESGLTQETVAHLNALYGSRFYNILKLVRSDARGSQTICPHSRDILAQIWHAVKDESAFTVGDFLLRRSMVGLASCQGLDAVETVAQEMGHLLGWSIDEQRQQVETYRSLIALSQRFRVGTAN